MPTPSYAFPFPSTYPDVTGAGLGPLDTVTGGAASVPAPTGVVALDTSNIQTAINSLTATNGGTVQLQSGTYRLASSSRTDATASYTGSGTTYTWTDASIVAADVGAYVLGAGVNGRAPQIVKVTAGSGFTTDIAPVGTISSASIDIVHPGIVLPDGVTLNGVGASYGGSPQTSLTSVTTLYDSGTGVSVLLRGGTNNTYYSSRSKITNLSIWGSATGVTYGSTLAGVWINNNSSFVEMDQLDISGHGTYGLALDYNANSLDCRNTAFTYNGSATNSSQGGGVIMDPLATSIAAAINFYNCWWDFNQGFGLCGTNGKDAWSLYGCQFNNTLVSSAFNSGTACFVGGSNALISNCWFESSATFDLWVSFGFCSVYASDFIGVTNAYAILTGGTSILTIDGAFCSGQSSAVVNFGGGVVNWSGVWVDPSSTTFISGGGSGASIAQAAGIGSYGGQINTGALPVTVTTNAGTVPVTSGIANFTNTSAATMTITMAVTGATDGQVSQVRIFDFSAAAETITWVNTENGGTSVPTTSNGSTTLPKTVTLQFNGKTSKWRCIQSV